MSSWALRECSAYRYLGTLPNGDKLLKFYLWNSPCFSILRKEFYRARDSPDDEEKEILSSTSSNVREIWDGHRVVRQTGESKTIPLVYNPEDKTLVALYDHPRFSSPSPKSFREFGLVWYILLSVFPRRLLRIPRQDTERIPRDIPPNLTLNTPTGIPRKRTTSLLLITGLLIQAAVVVVNAFAVYRWKWVKSGKPIERYAYPLWAAGTGAITIGVWLCGWVVESSSEKMYATGDDGGNTQPGLVEDELRIIFMQQNLPAQNIPAYAIEPIPIGKKMMFSRRLWPPTSDYDPSSFDWRARHYRVRVMCVAIGTLLTLFGFVGQNIGTRGLHWSAGLLQLSATAVLTILRAVIRRNVGRLVDDKTTNTIEELKSGFEACDLTTKLIGFEVHLASALLWVRGPQPMSRWDRNQHFWTNLEMKKIDISLGNDDDDNYNTMISKILEAQILLTRHVPEVKLVKKAAANCLKAMDEILDLILPGHEEDAWRDLGAFLCVAVSDSPKGAAASTMDPKFRLIKAGTRRDERLHLLQAVMSSTRYIYLKEGWNPVFRILGHCAKDDVKARRLLLSAWIEPHHRQESSRVHIGQPLGLAANGDRIPPENWRQRAIIFGLPLSHVFWNAV